MSRGRHNLLAELAVAVCIAVQVGAVGGLASGVRRGSHHGGIASGIEQGADGLRQTVLSLNVTAGNAVALAQRRARDVYLAHVSSTWMSEVNAALWAHPASAGLCAEDTALGPVVAAVHDDALACVAERVPPQVPGVQLNAGQMLAAIDEYVERIFAKIDECDHQPFLQATLCKASRLTPASGELGALGSRVGYLGGQVFNLIDSNARVCTQKAAQALDALAGSVVHGLVECIKAGGHPTAAATSTPTDTSTSTSTETTTGTPISTAMDAGTVATTIAPTSNPTSTPTNTTPMFTTTTSAQSASPAPTSPPSSHRTSTSTPSSASRSSSPAISSPASGPLPTTVPTTTSSPASSPASSPSTSSVATSRPTAIVSVTHQNPANGPRLLHVVGNSSSPTPVEPVK